MTVVFKKAFSVNAFGNAFKEKPIAPCFHSPKVWLLPAKGSVRSRRETIMNQEELAYDMKLAEIAKLNIFAPLDGDDEEEREEEEPNLD